jgi:sugar lactone lactonase YvrE
MLKTSGSQIDVVVDHKCLLGEGPVWNSQTKTICWVDILNGEIHEYDPKQKVYKMIPVHQMIGAIAVCTNGDFITALQNGVAFINKISGALKFITDPESNLPNNRFNEGKCDPAGRFWAGTMSLSEEPEAGGVYVVEKDLSITNKIKNVTISNGMAWSIDYRTLYFIDTPTFEVISYGYEKSTGQITNKEVIIKIPKEDGYPDGMTIDHEGMLWIAHWDGWQVTRWNPNSGEKLGFIRLPIARVTSCTFGGESLEDLYITSAKLGLSREELEKQPLAGSLFVLPNCGFKGISAFEFKI